MVSVSVLITNGHELLLNQHLDKYNNKLIYSLPVVSTPTLIGAKRKIKKQIEEIGVSFFIEKEIYNQTHSVSETQHSAFCIQHLQKGSAFPPWSLTTSINNIL